MLRSVVTLLLTLVLTLVLTLCCLGADFGAENAFGHTVYPQWDWRARS
jgi:hypothetical protein